MRATGLLRSPCSGAWLYRSLHQPVCIITRPTPRIVTALATSQLITGHQLLSMATSGSPPGVAAPLAATLAVQNMVQLCKDLKLPVTYKANEVVTSDSQDRTFRVVVHAHSDHAFKKYLNTCATTDLMLYRGMLLTVTTDREIAHVKGAYVQQAFLPKFENEGQDSSIADQIVQQADERYMVVTIKHSGSLVTLSSEGFAAKNSIGNEYTAGAAVLLRAHFDRLHGEAQGAARLQAFMALLRQRQMAVSFEMVTACHGHHGQLPAAEYLVATAAQVNDPAAGRPAFLGWQDFLSFCLEQGLPVNDTWLFQGRQWAAAARTLLDDLALSGGITGIALNRLNQLVQDGTSSGCLHVSGTYPHDQWQGSRLEGFVVAQGQPYSVPLKEALQHLSALAGRQALALPSVPDALRAPYKALTLQLASGASLATAPSGNAMDITTPAEVAAGADGGAGKAPARTAAPTNPLVEYIAQQQESWLPHPKMQSQGGSDIIISRLLEVKAPGPLVQLPNGSFMVVRAALAARPDPAAVLSQAHQFILQQHNSGGSLHPQLDDKAVKKVVKEVEACIEEHQEKKKQQKSAPKGQKEEGEVDTANSQLAVILAKAPRVVLGAPDLGTALRYKKKMMMWRIAGGGTMARATSTAMATQASMDTRDSPAPPEAQASMDIDAPAAGTSASGTMSGGGASQPLDSMSGVGYCLMTFVIRNGLSSLGQGLQQYMGYVSHLARAWGLPEQHVAQVNMFARAWAGWAAKHGGVKASAQYLDVAEPFVTHFLDCMARGDMESLLGTTKSKDTFQGVLLLLDEGNINRAKEVQDALSADNLIDLTPSAQKGKKPTPCPPFSKSMVTQGTVIVHPPGMTLHKDLPEFLTAAGRSAFCAVVRNTDDTDFQTVKRVSGTTVGNRKKIEAIFAASASGSGSGTSREKLLEAAYRPQEVVSWLGKGVPLPTSDPSAICCFISIPGVGKTFLTEGLKSLPGVTSVSLRLLNGDRLKKGGQPPARFWYDVAGKASTTLGNGNVTVVVGDKNLVPSPPGNIQRAVTTLCDSGAVTVALVPSWSGTPQQDVGVAYPDLPFPLELIALCMLRVLQRKNHEGALDGSLGHAMTVMIMFALFFKNLSRDDLMSMLKTQFSVVVEMPVLALDSTDPNKQVPIKLLRLIAEGLGQFKESGKPQLPDAWEREMRAQLLENDTKKRLLALQVPADQSRATISQALVQGLQEAQAIARGDSDAEAKALLRSLEVKTEGSGGQLPRYIAASGQDEGALRDTVARLIPGLDLNMFSKNQFHVTLWHALDPVMGRDHAMRDELLAARGMPVEMQIVSIDHAPGKATAAQVQLLNAPEAAFTKPYHHITLAIAPGGTAKDANRLPEWIEGGQAERFELPEPLTLTGVVEGLS